MANKRDYISKDGNVYDNPFDAYSADKKWDQQEEIIKGQQKANELIEKQMNEARNNAEQIAKATRDAEKDRYYNEKSLERERQNNNERMEQIRYKNEETMRYRKLCDELGFDYEEIMKFLFILNEGGNKQLLIKINELKQKKEIHYSKIQNYWQKNKVLENEKEIDIKEHKLEELRNKYKIKTMGLNNLLQKKEQEDKSTNFFSRFINSMSKKSNNGHQNNIIQKQENEVIKLKEEISYLEKSIEDEKKVYQELKELPTELKEDWEMFIKVENELSKLEEKNKEYIYNMAEFKKFNEFRKQHYNNDVEMLFRKLNLGFDYINENEVFSTGDIESYLKYMENVIYDEVYKSTLDYYNWYSYDAIKEMKLRYEEKDNQLEIKTKELEFEKDESIDDFYDPVLNEAVDMVFESNIASTSFIQKKLNIGYSRAGRIIDQMEAMGIVSGYEGSKPRQILITKEEWEELKDNNNL